MKRHLIHIEEVKKVGAKLQFQVKLPRTIRKIAGIMVTAIPRIEIGIPSPPNEGEDIPPSSIVGESERGWLRLRIPANRDVFYAESVFYPSHAINGYWDFNEPGITSRTEVWFNGKKQEYFKVDVPLEDTIVEGFYEDRSSDPKVNYQLKVYLKVG